VGLAVQGNTFEGVYASGLLSRRMQLALVARTSPLQMKKQNHALDAPLPVHTPAWQEPMLQAVPSALGVAAPHSPVATSQMPAAVWHSPGAGQVTPAQRPARGGGRLACRHGVWGWRGGAGGTRRRARRAGGVR
jgi:hypothetical protein